eukprot:12348967-Ditylum_brightwellii.AAC.1
MPRSEDNKESAFFQVRHTDNELEIKGLCIPALAKKAPECAKRVTHFINAKLKALHTDHYIERVFTPEAKLEVSQYDYNLNTHKITTKDVEMLDCKDNELLSFELVEDLLKLLDNNTQEKNTGNRSNGIKTSTEKSS